MFVLKRYHFENEDMEIIQANCGCFIKFASNVWFRSCMFRNAVKLLCNETLIPHLVDMGFVFDFWVRGEITLLTFRVVHRWHFEFVLSQILHHHRQFLSHYVRENVEKSWKTLLTAGRRNCSFVLPPNRTIFIFDCYSREIINRNVFHNTGGEFIKEWSRTRWSTVHRVVFFCNFPCGVSNFDFVACTSHVVFQSWSSSPHHHQLPQVTFELVTAVTTLWTAGGGDHRVFPQDTTVSFVSFGTTLMLQAGRQRSRVPCFSVNFFAVFEFWWLILIENICTFAQRVIVDEHVVLDTIHVAGQLIIAKPGNNGEMCLWDEMCASPPEARMNTKQRQRRRQLRNFLMCNCPCSKTRRNVLVGSGVCLHNRDGRVGDSN